jgi:hypothetical protein
MRKIIKKLTKIAKVLVIPLEADFFFTCQPPEEPVKKVPTVISPKAKMLQSKAIDSLAIDTADPYIFVFTPKGTRGIFRSCPRAISSYPSRIRTRHQDFFEKWNPHRSRTGV